jgi:hypothetical protein
MDEPYDELEESACRKATEWKEKILREIKLGKNYDIEARYQAAKWAYKWTLESCRYMLGAYNVAPFCTELVLEALQLHGGRPILPERIDRLEDITIGLGAGFSSQGEVCGVISGHIIAIGIDVAYKLRETAMIRKEVAMATRKFCRQFRERFGALRCVELTGINFLKPDGSEDLEAFDTFVKSNPKCEDYIQFSIYAPFPLMKDKKGKISYISTYCK